MYNHISVEKYEIDIYGDANKEYNGFYMVVVNVFDSCEDNAKYLYKKCFYFKCEIQLLMNYIKENIDVIINDRNYSKYILRKKIECVNINY